jgi:hypothetical protein
MLTNLVSQNALFSINDNIDPDSKIIDENDLQQPNHPHPSVAHERQE